MNHNYSSLKWVLDAALRQASEGKGAERHGNGGTTPFMDQPLLTISRLLETDGGLAYQAIKKIREARGLPTYARQERELLGAINYIAAMILLLKEQDDSFAEIDLTALQFESLHHQKPKYSMSIVIKKDDLTPAMAAKLRRELEAYNRRAEPLDLAPADKNAPKSTNGLDYPDLETIMMITRFNDEMVTTDCGNIVVYPGGYWESGNIWRDLYARRFADALKTQAMLNPNITITGRLVMTEGGFTLDIRDQLTYVLELLDACGMYTVNTDGVGADTEIRVVYNHNLKKE